MGQPGEGSVQLQFPSQAQPVGVHTGEERHVSVEGHSGEGSGHAQMSRQLKVPSSRHLQTEQGSATDSASETSRPRKQHTPELGSTTSTETQLGAPSEQVHTSHGPEEMAAPFATTSPSMMHPPSSETSTVQLALNAATKPAHNVRTSEDPKDVTCKLNLRAAAF